MSSPSPPKLFCIGLGYSALVLARLVRDEGWRIAGSCRDEEQAVKLRADGFVVSIASRDKPPVDPMRDLHDATHILISVPPDEGGDAAMTLYGETIARCRSLSWIGYLSTTGVYGDRGGAWVDETSPLRPTGPRGERRVEAEAAWRSLSQSAGLPMHLFRLAGIYGPGRSALDTVRSGRAQRIVKPGQVFSRIHVADIAATLRASMRAPGPGRIYNVCDDDPAPPDDVVAFACALLGYPPPPPIPFEQAELSPMARSFYDDNKRVSNRRIKEELGVSLTYPSYREGLRALLAGS